MKPILNQYLNSFIDSKKLNISEFSTKTGIKRQTISKWLYGAEPNMVSLNKVKKVYPDFNTEEFYNSLYNDSEKAHKEVKMNMSEVDKKLLDIVHRIDLILDKVMDDLSACNIEKGRLLQENETLKKQLKIK